MKIPFHFFVLLPLFVVTSCSHVGRTSEDWRSAVTAEVARAGDRNWIVIADSAFPQISKIGSKTLLADAEVPEVLEAVLAEMARDEHVRPRIYMSDEIQHLDNDLAPGADRHRERVKKHIAGRTIIYLQRRLLMILLDDARATHNVLVIKTPTTIPYGSVYLELESGYWDHQAETQLRDAMKQAQRKKAAAEHTP